MTEAEARKLTRAQRYRLRQKGVEVPRLSPGPRIGFKQSAEHVAKRTRWGDEHHAWQGDDVARKVGWQRAKRRYKTEVCKLCTKPAMDRHHVNGDSRDNRKENVWMLCRRCHMKVDGRLEAVREQAKANQPKAVAARWS